MRFLLVMLFALGLPAVAVGREEPSCDPAFIAATPRWLERPGHVHDRFPPTRTELPMNALVVLDCLVASDGWLGCRVRSEEPGGWGFGEAAPQISRGFRMAPTTVEGEPTANRRYCLRVPFETGAKLTSSEN